jgi:ADP-ribose pyrophosphatase YjhB (NUDIX family)
VAIKESREEAGADVEPFRLLAILDKRCHDHPSDLYYIYKIFLECRFNGWITGDHLETSEVGFFAADNLPALSAPRNTPEQIRLLFDFHAGTITEPVFD